jgi:hypothetical protein
MARWIGEDYSGMRIAPLPFIQEDVDLIYLGLAHRAAKTGAAVAGRE